MKKDCVSGSATLDASKIRRTAIMKFCSVSECSIQQSTKRFVVLNAISSVALPMRNARGIIATRREECHGVVLIYVVEVESYR